MEAVNARFNEDLQRLTPENADGFLLNVGRPSDVLLSTGIADKPLRMYGNKLMKKAAKHGFSPTDIADLPKAISDPIAVFKGSREGSHAILTELKLKNGNVLAILELGKSGDIDFNVITSAYGKDTGKVINWINEGKLLYANKEKALNYLSSPAPIAGAPNNQGLCTAQNIVKNFQNPKASTTNLTSPNEKVNSKN